MDNVDYMDITTTTEVPVDEMCVPDNLDLDYIDIALVAAVAIIVILSLLERRTGNTQRCLGLRGYIGIVIPVNLLDQGRDRLGFAAAFGSMASVCFQLFIGNEDSQFNMAPKWCKSAPVYVVTTQLNRLTETVQLSGNNIHFAWVGGYPRDSPDQSFDGSGAPVCCIHVHIAALVLMLYVLLYCLMYYPIFACLATEWVFVGSILGAAYSTCWFFLNLKEVIECPSGAEAMFTGENVAVQAPCLLCLFVLIVRFIIIFTKHLIRVLRSRAPSQSQRLDRRRNGLAQPHHYTYVRQLLTPAGASSTEYTDIVVDPAPKTVVKRVSRWLYQNDPTFKYSPRIIAITTVSIICLYQFSILIVLATYQFQKFIPQFFQPDNMTGNSSTSDIPIGAEPTPRAIRLFLHVFVGSVIVSFAFSIPLSLLAIFKTMTNYRHSMRQLFKGQDTHMSFKRGDRNAYTILSYSMSYAGSQIAYTLWGFLVSMVVSTICCLLMAYLIVLPAIGKVPIEVLEYFANFLPGFVVILVFSLLQRVLSAFLVQRRESFTSDGRTTRTFDLALNNRKVYHNVQFILFFFYVVLGVFGCFWNIVKGIALGVFFLARLDKSRLIPGFDSWDMGYNYYTSFLHVEETHRHPVLIVCCDILRAVCQDRPEIKMQNYGACIESPDTASFTSVSLTRRRARNMWFKAYTLLRNKQLVNTEDDFDKLSDLDINFVVKSC